MWRVKQCAKPAYLRGRRWLARTLYAYDAVQLRRCFRELGIGSGDSVLLHSGFEAASGFTGQPGDIIDSLRDVVGVDGHVLMMSMPYRGASEHYAAGNPLFDVRRTPSAMGLLSEIFRRQADVKRSLSPLHPVLAQGPLAAWLVADHEQFERSCGPGTPFERLLNLDAKFLFFDAPYRSLTFMHYVEDHYRERLPVELYVPEVVRLRTRDEAGRERTVSQRIFSAAARDRRHFAPIEAMLSSDGRLRRGRIGNSELLCVRAADVLDCVGMLLASGTGIYR